MELVSKFKKPKEISIKFGVILTTSGNVANYVRALEKLVVSINPKKTELLVVEQNPQAPSKGILEYYVKDLGLKATWIASDRNVLGSAWNLGIKTLTAPYLMLLTDEVAVTNNFIEKLTFCMENFTTMYKSGPVGVVAPVMNYATKRQRIDIPTEKDEVGSTEILQREITLRLQHKYKNKYPWLIVGGISNSCMLVDRQVFTACGDFNESQLTDTHSGHDWFNRVVQSGFLISVAGDVFVYRCIPKSERDFIGYELPEYSSDYFTRGR